MLLQQDGHERRSSGFSGLEDISLAHREFRRRAVHCSPSVSSNPRCIAPGTFECWRVGTWAKHEFRRLLQENHRQGEHLLFEDIEHGLPWVVNERHTAPAIQRLFDLCVGEPTTFGQTMLFGRGPKRRAMDFEAFCRLIEWHCLQHRQCRNADAQKSDYKERIRFVFHFLDVQVSTPSTANPSTTVPLVPLTLVLREKAVTLPVKSRYAAGAGTLAPPQTLDGVPQQHSAASIPTQQHATYINHIWRAFWRCSLSALSTRATSSRSSWRSPTVSTAEYPCVR
jgi:hypothetical protein